MERDLSNIQMAAVTMENGKMENIRDMEHLYIVMDHWKKLNGMKARSREKVKYYRLME